MKQNYFKINKTIMNGWIACLTVLFVAYLIQLMTGERKVEYFAAVVAFEFIPYIIALIVYFKNRGSAMISYICAIGYSIFYAFVLFTGNTYLVTEYIIPIIFLLMIAMDRKLIVIIGALATISNAAYVVYNLVSLKHSSNEYLINYEIMIGIVAVCLVIAYMSTKRSINLNRENVSSMESQQQMQAALLGHIQSATKEVNGNTEKINSEIEVMAGMAGTTASSMQEMAAGMNQTSEAIQNQLTMTANIQETVEQCAELSKEIESYSKEVGTNVDKGIRNIANLHESAIQTKENSSNVSLQMSELMAQTEEAINIVNMIQGIAGKTNLLALNASIEAARAGEAGRGFSVVASEITALANQTQSATQNIEQLISKLKEEASDASKAVDVMTNISNTQNNLIFDTEQNFNQIKGSVDKMSDNITIQGTQMSVILSAAKQMFDNINTLSSISEEITAGTNAAIATTDKNKEIADKVTELVQELVEHMEELDEMQII